MGVDIVADKYSTAIFELAKEQNMLEQMEQDLSYVKEVMAEQPDLRHVLVHPVIEGEDKCKLLAKLFDGNVHKFALQFLYVMIKRRREGYIVPAITSFITKAREARNILEAKVTVASALGAVEESKLRDKLKALTGKDVVLDIITDPSIIGGLVVQMGDKRIDGSVERRLQELEKSLLKAGTTEIGVNEQV